MKDLLSFDKMITPRIIQVVYFLGLLAIICSALFTMFYTSIWVGVIALVMGCLGVRIYCELMILFFRIYQTLLEINQQMKNRP